jgi:DNA-binding CsgD family transcriptional regulator
MRASDYSLYGDGGKIPLVRDERPLSRSVLQRNVLNARELEALAWSARGKTSIDIAKILGVSKRTVDFHIENARVKLGAVTRVQAVVKAATSGLIDV